MGCQVLNTYLSINPEIVKKVSGVIYCAPFFDVPDFVDLDPPKKFSIHVLSKVLGDFILVSGMPLHMVTRNK